ncbi:MAG: quinolinate synthase NadA [bacterium]
MVETCVRSNLIRQIKTLKAARKAVILAHNYQIDEVQAIADILGDSLELARAASKVQAETIIFCGVYFMAESAAILNPAKKVLLPNVTAGCPLADMINADQLRDFKKLYPDAAVVCYVNSSAEIKAESDICCTSSNAIKIINSLDEKRVIFVPDRNLGKYASSFTNKEMILWNGYCPTHVRLSIEDVLRARKEHPKAVFVAHPECEPEVLAVADYVCSTGKMLQYAKETSVKELIIGTEIGMLYRLRKENPDKQFYIASPKLICPNMKKINSEGIYSSLTNLQHEIQVPEDIRQKACRSIKRMLDVS